jgi:hypothetical protein
MSRISHIKQYRFALCPTCTAPMRLVAMATDLDDKRAEEITSHWAMCNVVHKRIEQRLERQSNGALS